MKINYHLMLVVLTGISLSSIQASEEPTVQWNEKTQSRILNKPELEKIGPAFGPRKIIQVTWPSMEEIKSKSVTVDVKLKESCIEWIKKFIAEDYLLPDLEKNLIALKRWGLITEESDQKRLRDVFLTRFKKDPFVIQIYESPGDVVITVSDERLAEKPRVEYRDWVLEVAALVLNYEKLKPNPDMLDVLIHEIEHENSRIIRVSWWIDSVTKRTDSEVRTVSGLKAAKIGASHVVAETNGKFITFRIPKEVGGPTRPNYVKERFSSPETSPDPNS